MTFSTVIDAIAYWAEKTPDKISLIEAESGKQLTYGQLWKLSVKLSDRLKLAGLGRGERVVVRVGSLIETFVAQFGIYLAGGVYCPLERNMKELGVSEMLKYFQSDFLISSAAVQGASNWIDLSTVQDVPSEYNTTESIVLPKKDEICAIIFTTGTTGKAKGVMRSHQGASTCAVLRQEAFKYTQNDIFMSVQPLDRTTGISLFYAILFSGGTAVHQQGIVFLKEFFQTMKTHAVTSLNLPSSALSMVLSNDAPELKACGNHLKTLILAGSSLADIYKMRLLKLLPETRHFVVYGATEISPISIIEYSRRQDKLGSVGKPCKDTAVMIVDENGIPVKSSSKDDPGIVACRNDSMMLGYWGDNDLTQKTVKNGMITMTDIGYFDDDGFLYILGRRDDVIVSGGFKIAPYEIEAIAAQMTGITECACVSIPDRIFGSVPKLFVRMEKGYEFSAKKILDFLSQILEPHKLPRIIREIDAFPRVGESQKIDKRELANLD